MHITGPCQKKNVFRDECFCGLNRPQHFPTPSQCEAKSVLFTGNGKWVLSDGDEGVIRQWRVEDGKEVGEPKVRAKGEIYATALSSYGKWLVCGLRPSLNHGS